jgi:CubicO group peptidase (beta-lactamase class C family)
MNPQSPLHRFLALGLAVGLLLAACSGDDDAADAKKGDDTPSETSEAEASAKVPGDEWAEVDPAEADLDAAPLDELATFLESKDSECMAVVKDGQLVAEQYWDGFTPDKDREVFSVTKSITSTLVGIAQDEGDLSVDEPASKYITEWQGTPSESVTIENLISNDSGRFWSQSNDYGTMIQQADKTTFAIGLTQQDPPGSTWVYNNSAIQTLEAVLERATGQPVDEFAQEHLFEPIGMTSEMAPDPSGNTLTFMGLQAGCTDLARFGYLFAQDGMWGDEQVVSSDWVEAATSPSQDLQSYGYLWWLNKGSDPAAQLRWPHAPEDAYTALGLFEQVILVLPDQDMVVVRAGPKPSSSTAGQGNLVDEMARLAMAADGATP